MNYQAFLAAIFEEIRVRFDEEYEVSLRQIPKNNGCLFDAISICKKGDPAAPTMYLQQLFENFQKGQSLDEIADEVKATYHQGRDSFRLTPALFSCPEYIRPRICFRLVSREKNRELLESIPHILLLDLAKIYFLELGISSGEHMTSTIHFDHCRIWNLSPDELEVLANANTPRLFPAKCFALNHVLANLSGPALSILTNEKECFGSAAMLYPGLLAHFSKEKRSDLVIFPSSIHEVLLLPDFGKTTDFASLCEMVRSINAAEVLPTEQLSDCVYYYRATTNTICVYHENEMREIFSLDE